jgi:hypothetical protein
LIPLPSALLIDNPILWNYFAEAVPVYKVVGRKCGKRVTLLFQVRRDQPEFFIQVEGQDLEIGTVLDLFIQFLEVRQVLLARIQVSDESL